MTKRIRVLHTNIRSATILVIDQSNRLQKYLVNIYKTTTVIYAVLS